MHDKDCSGTIDVDECMEILFRRFGKDALENKVTAFMANDADEDQTISFTEFLAMDKRNDTQGTRNHSGKTISSARMCPEQPLGGATHSLASRRPCVCRDLRLASLLRTLNRLQAVGWHLADDQAGGRQVTEGVQGAGEG